MSSIRPWYFSIFSWILSREFWLLQYVSSMNWTVSMGLDLFGGFPLYG
jgi:hypothetical protein